MRIRASKRWALWGAIGAVMTAIGAAYLPTPHAAASVVQQGTSLQAGDFQQVAAQGFGDPQNSWAWSMAWFNNRLYVGTMPDYICVVAASFNRYLPWLFPYPPAPDPNQTVPCNPDPQALPTAGQIWAVDPSAATPLTQSNWSKVYQSPYSVTVNITRTSAITMAARDIGFRDMSVYTDTDGTPALYVSGVGGKPVNGKNVPPPSLLRSTDGQTFSAVPADPGTTMGDINSLRITGPYNLTGPQACCLRGQVAFAGHFYLLIGSFEGGGAVFASADPRQGDNSFQEITPPNMSVFEMEPYTDNTGTHLFVGVQSTKGYSVWKTDCTAPPPGQTSCPMSAFTQVVPNGGGLGSKGNGGITSMHVFTDADGVAHLYVGTDGADDTSPQQPAEIIRINPDDSWDLIVGNPRTVGGHMKSPLSGLTSGFGWYFNVHMWRMETYQGVLYVGTNDVSSLIAAPGSGSPLQPQMGFDLWASTDGVTFQPVTQNGFGDPFSYGARSLQQTPYGLFVGSANQDQGLRIWQGQPSPSELESAPQNVQSEPVGGTGGVALAWDAPPGAAVYHVYRATPTQWTVPKKPPLRYLLEVGSKWRWPHHVSVPRAFTEIGTTTNPYFVDHNAPAHGRTEYYVVAQNANGTLSVPSNEVTTGLQAPATTFRYVYALLAYLGSRDHVPAGQVSGATQALHAAYTQLHAGDAQGSHSLVDALRRQILSTSHGTTGRLFAEQAAWLLGRLERRITLVEAHVLGASQLY